MTGEELNKLCSKKAFEIAYAIFRVSKNINHDDLSGYLESQALGLLNGAVTQDFDEVLGSIQAIEYFLRLGSEISLVSQGNAQIIINEARGLNAAIIAGSSDRDNDEDNVEQRDLDLESIFSSLKTTLTPSSSKTALPHINTVSLDDDDSSPFSKDDGQEGGDFESYEELREKERGGGGSGGNEDGEEEESGVDENLGGDAFNSANSAAYSAKIRQSTILDKIQEGGHFRLKDVHKLMPDLSERTLRYDLQKLVEDGFIERVGSGGPGSYYQTKEV